MAGNARPAAPSAQTMSSISDFGGICFLSPKRATLDSRRRKVPNANRESPPRTPARSTVALTSSSFRLAESLMILRSRLIVDLDQSRGVHVGQEGRDVATTRFFVDTVPLQN